jgi:hypothetical protein
MRSPLATRVLLGAGLAALSLPAFTVAAHANTKASPPPPNATCSGPLPSGTYNNVTAQSGSCSIGNTDVITGNVTVQGATLWMSSATVKGSVTAQASPAVNIGNSTIGGNVTVQSGGGPVLVDNPSIGGNLTLQGNGAGLYAMGNHVVGSIVVQNDSTGLFWFNTAGANCISQNSVLGLGNTAGGTNGCNS